MISDERTDAAGELQGTRWRPIGRGFRPLPRHPAAYGAVVRRAGEDFKRYGTEARWGSTGKTGFTWLGGVDFMTYTSNVYSLRTGTVTGSNATAISLKRQLRRRNPRKRWIRIRPMGNWASI
jgi:hypothetical protein